MKHTIILYSNRTRKGASLVEAILSPSREASRRQAPGHGGGIPMFGTLQNLKEGPVEAGHERRKGLGGGAGPFLAHPAHPQGAPGEALCPVVRLLLLLVLLGDFVGLDIFPPPGAGVTSPSSSTSLPLLKGCGPSDRRCCP